MRKNKPEPKITPAQYREMLKKISLDAIFLDSCSVKTNRDEFAAGVKLDIRHKASYSVDDETVAKITSVYDLVVFKTRKRDFTLKISCTYTLLFSSDDVITDDFMEIFVEINAQITTWPYFREFVQNMVQRTGLPPLTLPLLL